MSAKGYKDFETSHPCLNARTFVDCGTLRLDENREHVLRVMDGSGEPVPGAKLEEHHGDADYLGVTQVPSSGHLVLYMGSAWDQFDERSFQKEVKM